MFINKNSLSLRRMLLALALSACAGLAAADTTYHVELDTTGFGSNGWIDLQFNPGSAGNSAAATVGLSGFTGFDASIAADMTDSVTGSLAGGYSIANTYDSNDLFHAVNFGGTVGFNVTFSGAADPSAQVWGSLFTVALMDAGQTAFLGNYGADGFSLLQLSWTPAATVGGQGVVGSEIYDTAAVSVSAVPEPSTWLMLAAGLGLVGWSRRRVAG
ncbi:NF038129 family PEP-CTERM protein [Duganella aceris]|jgi:hypothetical protein|uniref:PEP-CTERM sorting domain-containing protein n=1 Tax=Duganella aceris TaxID=2703883 RepID=A0ABX0FTJ7_9BURK|nr:NF038129 family PEP-CTERM protein [Duganella aceris]NGZ88016.1 PEP-CTERM sorting domain-containing protein [Duganella aceris]